jgi:nitrogen fixation/metabolism regulation signal transduction histidine kinase
MAQHRRRIRLIRPRLQLRLIGGFLGVSLLALVLQYLLFQRTLTEAALALPHDGAALMSKVNGWLGAVLGISLLLVLPATFAVGLVLTHRIAGPVYRLEMFLREVLERRTSAECKLRKGDELQDLCTLVNRATENARNAVERESERSKNAA